MCGIFGYSGTREDAGELVLAGLRDLEYRGYDSWGVAVVADGQLLIEKEVGKIANHRLLLPRSQVGIGHTRWATHGGVTKANAHPHLDCTGSVAVIHNGIVENFEELKMGLAGAHRFVSQTDTEVVAHLVEELRQEFLDFTEVVRQAFLKLDGMNVVVLLDKATGKIVAAKKGSPLVVGVADDGVFVASDASAVLPYTRQLVFVDDGQMVEISDLGQRCRFLEVETGREIEVRPEEISWQVAQADLGQFDHFMLKEIFEQSRVLRNLAEQAEDKVGPLSELVEEAYGSFMVGCGTASYAALAGSYLFSRVASRHVNSVVGSEFLYQEQYLRPDSLVMAISQSGETMDIVESVKLAKAHHSKVVAITNSLGSTLHRLADAKVLLEAGPEKAVCATKSFTAMVGVLLLLSYRLAGRLDEGCALLRRAADEVEAMLTAERLETVKQAAHYAKEYDHIFVIGRGLSYPASLEAALKIKEVSYIHAEGFAGGELKHGVIALIEQGTPCIVFAPEDETKAAILSNAMELKARGGYIIGVSAKHELVFDHWVPLQDVGDASIITNVVPAQLLGYYLALAKGYDPDKPRNLAKSVTVR